MQDIVLRNRQNSGKVYWLELQKADRYLWQNIGNRRYFRRMGVVESLFDGDGEYWCGRADLHQNVRFEVKTNLSESDLKERLILAWTLMRHSHVLLSSKALFTQGSEGQKWTEKGFVYDWPLNIETAVEETRSQVIFVADQYPDLDAADFFHHVMNTGRAIDSRVSLSRLYVMAFRNTSKNTIELHLIPILAHQITDGLTTYRWINHLSYIMNTSLEELTHSLRQLFDSEEDMRKRLPPAQEALYPVRSLSRARERWHWLLTRILRYVRRPPPASFQNPLRRDKVLSEARSFPEKYERVLNYGHTPPLNAGHVGADLYGRSVQNMRRLCKEAGISIGSGCFTLVAMVMMQLEEQRTPEIDLAERLPFVGSFPVNPRPFFSGEPTTGNENSCMLAFSDGVTLPFLPRDLDFVGRFRLLGRLAHRQLRQYQKKKKSLEEEIHLGSRSPSQLIPALFCSTLERMEGRVPEGQKAGVTVQGNYPARAGPSLATCGISSVGDVSALLTPPAVNLDESTKKDIVAELKGMGSTVRPRDGEFLVGAIGMPTHLGFGVSYDANAIDPDKAREWKRIMESILDRELVTNLSAKL